MSITPKQRAALHAAIMEAFSPAELDELLYRRFGKHIYDFSGGGALPKIVEEVMGVAERNGWLVDLARHAAEERPKSVSLPNLAQEIELMIGSSIARELVEMLIDVITADPVHVDFVLDGYTLFVSPNTAYDIEIHSLADAHAAVVTRLGRASRGDQRHPLLRFAAYLARQAAITAATRVRLETWIGSALDAWELPRDVRTELEVMIDETIDVWRPADLHLLIEVGRRPGVLPAKGTVPYEVSGWRLLTAPDGSAIGQMVRVGEQRPCNADEVPSAIIGEILRMQRARKLTKSFAVELFLPLELMPMAIDQSSFEPPDEEASPLGSRFRLYLRSWERIFEPALSDIRTEWQLRWEEGRSKGWRAWKVDRGVFDSGMFARQMRAQNASRVALTFAAMQPRDYVRPHGAIWRMIAAGTPVALWPRAEAADYQALVETLVVAGAGDWRDEVFAWRVAAAAAEDHRGSQLVLLWDDPGHRPPNDPSNEQFMEMK